MGGSWLFLIGRFAARCGHVSCRRCDGGADRGHDRAGQWAGPGVTAAGSGPSRRRRGLSCRAARCVQLWLKPVLMTTDQSQLRVIATAR